MARVELPKSSLKARRRRRRLILGAFFTVVVLLICGVLVGLTYVPFLRITEVEVSGAHTIATSSVQALVKKELSGKYGYVFAEDNIFIYPKQTLITLLQKKFPTFKLVDVHAQNFHTIAVVVVERQPKGLWCMNSCYFMDEDGVVYAPAPNFSEPPYITYQGGSGTVPHQYLTVEQFHNLSALVDALSQIEPTDPIRQVAVDTNGDVRAYYQDSFVLMFELKAASGDVFDRFTLARKAAPFAGQPLGKFEYLDLRFGDKLYYKQK